MRTAEFACNCSIKRRRSWPARDPTWPRNQDERQSPPASHSSCRGCSIIGSWSEIKVLANDFCFGPSLPLCGGDFALQTFYSRPDRSGWREIRFLGSFAPPALRDMLFFRISLAFALTPAPLPGVEGMAGCDPAPSRQVGISSPDPSLPIRIGTNREG